MKSEENEDKMSSDTDEQKQIDEALKKQLELEQKEIDLALKMRSKKFHEEHQVPEHPEVRHIF